MTRTGRIESKYLLIPILIFFAVIVLRNAWICDDAYISFRTIDNFVHGHGLTWNVSERVQVFTHPLWLFLLVLARLISGEIYFAALFVSFGCVIVAAAWLAFKISGSVLAAGVGIAALTFSSSFVDYSSSGLENPLTFLILALFLYVFFRKESNYRTFFYLCLLSSLAALTRPDAILLYLPPLLFAFWKVRSSRAVLIALLSFLPFILWELFSLFYYGFPFPNTAYAKLNTGLESSLYIKQGIAYLVNLLGFDSLGLFIIVSGIIVAIIKREFRPISAASGIILYLLYVIRIGGCFMAGRYFAAPVFMAVIILIDSFNSKSKRLAAIFGAVVLILGLTSPYSPINSITYEESNSTPVKFNSGIIDERLFYHDTNSLVNYDRRAKIWPSHPWAYHGCKVKARGDKVRVAGVIGMFGYFTGPSVHIIDDYALSDALLAHLPAHKGRTHRIGHFLRIIPEGYTETLETGENRIVDKNIAEYYDKISFLIKGDLYSWKRIKEIFKINLGLYDHLIKGYGILRQINVNLSSISEPKERGTQWLAPGNFVIYAAGIKIDLESVFHARNLEISHDHNDDLRAVFLLNKEKVGEIEIPANPVPEGGLAVSVIAVPQEASQRGYDHIEFYPVWGDGMYSIGHIRLIEDNSN